MSNLLTDEELKELLLDINTELVICCEWHQCNAKKIVNGDYERALMTLPSSKVGDYEGIIDSASDEMGESAYDVFLFRGQHYKVCYSYKSHEGSNYDYARVYRVKPVVKTVTVYECT